VLFMKGCRLSSTRSTFLYFFFFSHNLLLCTKLSMFTGLWQARHPECTLCLCRGKSPNYPRHYSFTLNSNLFLRRFLFRSYTGTGLYSVHLFICAHALCHACRYAQLRPHDLVRCGRPIYVEISMPSGMDHSSTELARSRTRFFTALARTR